MKTSLLLALCGYLFSLSSCKSTSEPEPTAMYTLSGRIDNQNHIALPNDARLVVAWFVVDPHSGYVYTYGDGAINLTNNTFTVKFANKPPYEARPNSGIGLAYIALVSSAIPQNGIVSDLPPLMKFYGVVDSAAVIYIEDSTLSKPTSWISKFSNGYSFSTAVFSATGYDYFVPAAPSNITLRIDTTITEFSSVNWY
ncbi:MAG: hypothetical protein IPM69_05570 [Ignavibacteria bacterium]|nr:hypothetical protein [Ignavibacteria bacterium]